MDKQNAGKRHVEIQTQLGGGLVISAALLWLGDTTSFVLANKTLMFFRVFQND